jgi:hypothetical protein
MSVRSHVVLGGALLVAFSLGLFELVDQWLVAPWSRYSALFVLLLGWQLARERDARPSPVLGVGLIVAAAGLQLLSVASAVPAIARIAFVAAVMGFLLLRGFASLRVAVLAVFIVPVPSMLTELLAGQYIAEALFSGAAALLQWLGVTITSAEREVLAGDTLLRIRRYHGGLTTLIATVGLAWYVISGARAPMRHALRLVAGFLSLGVIAQVLGVVLACMAVVAGSESAASTLLDTVGWLVPTVVAVYVLERLHKQRSSTPGLPAPAPGLAGERLDVSESLRPRPV